MVKWVFLTAAIASEVTASLSLKAAQETPAIYAVVVPGYLAAFGFLAKVLKLGMPLGVAYGIWGACGVAATALLSALLFAEPLTVVMWVGIGLIAIGVLAVEVGAQRARLSDGDPHPAKPMAGQP